MSDSPQPVLELRDVTCAADGHAVRAVSLRFHAGGMYFIAGECAARRAALLRVLGLVDPPEGGDVLLETRNIGTLAGPDRDELRNQRCGFLFAAPFLLPAFSVVENVAMPLFKISHFTPEQARERTDLLLAFVGLTDEAQQSIDDITRLQQHSVSLARALANDPAILTVESFDAALGAEDSAAFSALLRQSCAHFGVAVIASVAEDFSFEPGDHILAIDAAGAVRESIVEGKPIA